MRASFVLVIAFAAVALGVGFGPPAHSAPQAQTASAPPAAAQPSNPQPTLRQIAEQQTKLRGDVAAKKGAFKDLTETERAALMKTQTRVLGMLEGRQSIEELRPEEKVELFNHLEWISATVRQAEEDRKICERSRLVGTNRFTVVCMTAKQKREFQENAQKSLRTTMKCEEGCIAN